MTRHDGPTLVAMASAALALAPGHVGQVLPRAQPALRRVRTSGMRILDERCEAISRQGHTWPLPAGGAKVISRRRSDRLSSA